MYLLKYIVQCCKTNDFVEKENFRPFIVGELREHQLCFFFFSCSCKSVILRLSSHRPLIYICLKNFKYVQLPRLKLVFVGQAKCQIYSQIFTIKRRGLCTYSTPISFNKLLNTYIKSHTGKERCLSVYNIAALRLLG